MELNDPIESALALSFPIHPVPRLPFKTPVFPSITPTKINIKKILLQVTYWAFKRDQNPNRTSYHIHLSELAWTTHFCVQVLYCKDTYYDDNLGALNCIWVHTQYSHNSLKQTSHAVHPINTVVGGGSQIEAGRVQESWSKVPGRSTSFANQPT